jgi:hypothetical protein
MLLKRVDSGSWHARGVLYDEDIDLHGCLMNFCSSMVMPGGLEANGPGGQYIVTSTFL